MYSNSQTIKYLRIIKTASEKAVFYYTFTGTVKEYASSFMSE